MPRCGHDRANVREALPGASRAPQFVGSPADPAEHNDAARPLTDKADAATLR
jgi:hypothetical protein